jgi:hypothetical protein
MTDGSPGVNFINVPPAAFMLADPKRAKKTVKPLVFFASFLGSLSVKAARRTLMQLTAGEEISF